MDCINTSDPKIKKLVDTFGTRIVEKGMEVFPADKTLSVENFINDSTVRKHLGVLNTVQLRNELGVSYGKTISSKGLANLAKTISKKNTSNANNNIDVTYYFRKTPVGESTESYYAVFKLEKPLDLDAKEFRVMQKIVDPSQDTTELMQLQSMIAARQKQIELISDNTLTEEQENSGDYFNGDEALREQDRREFELFQKQLNDLENTYFNISDPDLSRAKSLTRLNRLLYNTANAMGITVKKMEQYSIEYSNRNGKRLNQLGIANLLDKVLAYSENDGVTFPEEMFHFIVAANEQSPEIQQILNLVDQNGVKLITQTDVWAQNRDKYAAIYDNNMEKVELEILGKLLAQYTYDTYQYKTISQRLLRALDAFLRFFKIKTRFAKQLNRSNFNDELLRSFGYVVENLESGAYNKVFNPKPLSNLNTYNVVLTPNNTFVIEETNQLGNKRILTDSNGNTYTFSSLSNATDFINNSKEFIAVESPNYFKDVLERVIADQQLKIIEIQSRIVGLISKESKALFEYFKNKYPNIDIQSEIKALIDRVNSGQPLTPTESQTLDDLVKYQKLTASNASDIENSKKIDRLQARVNQMNILLRQRKFHAGLHLYFFGINNNTGVIKDIQDILDYIERVKNKEVELSDIAFSNLVENMKMHKYIIDTLKLEYGQGRTLEELTDDQNDQLRDVVNNLKNKVDDITQFLEISAPRVKKLVLIKNGGANPNKEIDLNKETFEDSSIVNYWRGSLKNVTDEWGRLFHNKLVVLAKSIQDAVVNRSVSLYNDINDDLKKIGSSGLRKMKEKDKNGNDNGYWISERLTGEFEEYKDAYFQDILKKLDEYALANFGINYNLQSGKMNIEDFFNGNLLLNMKDSSLDDELKRRKKLQDLYNKYLVEFSEANTMLRPNWQQILEEKKKTMNKTQYAKYLKANVRVINFPNYSITLYKGELVMPSDGTSKDVYVINDQTVKASQPVTKSITTKNYTNPEYAKLQRENPEVIKVLNKLKEHHNRAKFRLPTATYSWEYENRLPQISKSALDVATSGKKLFANLGEKISEVFSPREDDEIYANRFQGSIIKRPVIRYLSKIKPQFITDDLFRAVVLFDEMTERHIQYTKALPELQSMIDVLEYSKVNKNSLKSNVKKFFIGKDSIISGSESQLKKKLDFTVKRLIFGEEVDFNESLSVNINGKEYDVNKISERLFSWLRNNNLMGNTVSQVVGFFSGQLNKVTEIVIGSQIDKEEMAQAEREALRTYALFVKDFENPVKTTKLAIALQNLGLIDSIEESFGDLDKGRGTRVISKLANYGGWRAFDYTLKAPVVIAIARSIRLINGEWVSKRSFKGTKDEWNAATSLWDEISTENGKIKYSDKVTPAVVNLWKTKALELTLRLDEQTSEEDKALWHTHWFFRFFTLHQGWLDNMMGMAFKSRGYNWSTDQVEAGYYRTGFKFLFNPAAWITAFKDWSTYDQVEKDNIKRIGMYLTWSGIAYALAYIMNAIALDDDDEENVPFLHFLYISTRLSMETSSKVAFDELLEYIIKPAGGLEKISDVLSPFEFFLALLSEQEEVEQGMYAGYNKTTKKLIQSLPLIRGLFENLYGGYVNEYLEKPSTSVGVALDAKNNFVKTKNYEDKGIFENLIFGTPMGYLSKIIGYGLGYTYADSTTSMAESKGPGTLPTKKANE